jgi:ParB family chromosome partitioning protein
MEQKRILIIENDPVFEADVRLRLESFEMAVTSVADGAAGIDTAKDSPPDLILLAAELPGMSGYSVCNRIKKSNNLKEVPVVIVSTGETPETFEQHQSHRTPADDYLIKGGSGESVVNRVVTLLEAAVAPGEAPPVAPEFPGEPDELEGAFDALTAPPSEEPAEEEPPREPASVEPVAPVEELESIEELKPIEEPPVEQPRAPEPDLDAAFDHLTEPKSSPRKTTSPPPLKRKKKKREADIEDEYGFDNKLNFLRKNLKKRERELDESRKESSKAKNRYEEASHALKKMNEKFRAKEEQAEQLDEERADLANKLMQTQKELEEITEQLEESVRRFDEERTGLRNTLEEQSNKIIVLQETLQLLTQKKSEESSEYEEQLEDNRRKLELLQESLDEITREKEMREEDLGQEVEVERGRADLLQDSIDATATEKESLEQRVSELESARSANRNSARVSRIASAISPCWKKPSTRNAPSLLRTSPG